MSVLVAYYFFFFFLMIRRPPRSTLSSSSAASDVYKRQAFADPFDAHGDPVIGCLFFGDDVISAVFYVLCDPVHSVVMVEMAAHLAEGV